MKRNATFGMPLVFRYNPSKGPEEKISGFPSASQPLFSSPSTKVLILKLLTLFPFLLVYTVFLSIPNKSLLDRYYSERA